MAAPPAPLPPVALDHPKLTDTATLEGPGETIKLFGVVGLPGPFADGLKGYIAEAGDRVTCQPRDHAEFVCALDNGTDIAMAALINGAAQARADAPDAYVSQQTEAQAARRGVWASLPPPPVAVKHPSVQDTATLVADGQNFVLDGIDGVAGGYAVDLQGYIAGNGDSLLCQAQGEASHYVCLLPDGTDIAKVALVNGAARVAADAPDAYRVQQADAITNRRGIWAGVSEAQVQVLLAPAPSPPPSPDYTPDYTPDYVAVPEEPLDGFAYVAGVPTAVIDGGTVFFAFVGGLGWGYWDNDHHWRNAPDRYAGHLEHYHPAGAGLRGYGPRAGIHSVAAHGGPAVPGAPGLHAGAPGTHNGVAGAAGPGIPGRPVPPGQVPGAHPGMPGRVPGPSAPFVHPTAPSAVGPGHPAAVTGRPAAMPHAPMPVHEAPAMHGAPAFHAPPPSMHAAPPAFHAAPPAMHAAPAFHAPPPAFHAAPAVHAPVPKNCKSKC